MKKPFPTLETDEAAERFIDEADLSEYDFSGFKFVRFELLPKTRHVNLRFPEPLLTAVKSRAAQECIPYQRYIRLAVEQALTGQVKPTPPL